MTTLARDFVKLQRRTARGYTCPICADVFLAEPGLWDHGLRNHPEYVKWGRTQYAESRRHFRQEALDRTLQVVSGSKSFAAAVAPDRPPQSNPRPDWSQPHRAKLGSFVASPAFDLGATPRDGFTSFHCPRTFGVQRPNGPRSWRGKPLLGRKDAEQSHQSATLDDPDSKREPLGPKQPLWGPSSEPQKITKVHPTHSQRSNVNPIRRNFPPKDLYSSYQGVELVDQNMAHSPPDFGYSKPLVQQNFGGPTTFRPDWVKEDRPSSELNPKMLIEPETRPISHELLVVEVKGNYAGLVMVEAKCIEIDERQSAAAQDKPHSRRAELKDHQWSSLEALQKELLHEYHDVFSAS